MDERKLEDVSKMLEIESTDVIDSKIKRYFKNMAFPFIQTGFFLFSSLSGLAFGYWENEKPSIYPWGFIPRVFLLGPLLVIGTGLGNSVLSFKTKNKFRIGKAHKAFVVFLNIVLSFISFFLLYGLIEEVAESLRSPCHTVEYHYGVYNNNNFDERDV